MTPKKKLIEVALPLYAINRAARDEKAVPRPGHPQTMHYWWARRPLAAARAVIFAQMADDPSSCPGHPLLDSVIDLTLERHRDLLKRGAVLVDERDPGTQQRVLFNLEHSTQDASLTRSGERRIVSKRMLYVELDSDGTTRHVHRAPYLDYRPLHKGDPGVEAILDRPECAWIAPELEQQAQGCAVAHVVPEHLAEVRSAKLFANPSSVSRALA